VKHPHLPKGVLPLEQISLSSSGYYTGRRSSLASVAVVSLRAATPEPVSIKWNKVSVLEVHNIHIITNFSITRQREERGGVDIGERECRDSVEVESILLTIVKFSKII
jgi:hypothetical protein